MKSMINKLVLWLLIPAIAMGSWVTPAAGTDSDSNAPQAVSTIGESPAVAQVEATPVVTEPEAPAPANSDPTSTSPATDTGTNSAAPADFPNVCESDPQPVDVYSVGFTVVFPEGDTTSSLQVRVFAENGGCIPGYGYAGPVMNFPDKPTGYGPQTVELPAGRYVYEYSGDGFEPKSYVPFQVDGVEDNVIITPVPIPAAETVTLDVTIPAGGSSMTIVISDQTGTVESFTVTGEKADTSTGITSIQTTLPARGSDYDYYYEYWGDDYPWSDRQPFQVVEGQETVITIAPVIASITLTPSQAPAGTSVEVRVTGFRAGDEYELNFNNGQIVEYGTTDDGNISQSFTVPSLPEGKYPVVVTGAVSGQRVEATFTVGPEVQASVSLNPTSGQPLTVVRVSGSGYAPNERVDILFGGATGQLVGYRIADEEGTFTGAITIPSSASTGDHTIVAEGGTSGQSATATYTVTERVVNVAVSPKSANPGTVVTVTGSGFLANEIVDIYWGSDSGPRLGYRTADNSGSFTGRVTVPKTASAGDHALFATGRTSRATGSANVSVTAPQVSVSPTSQASGKVVSVSGSGFQPGERVDIRWNGPSGSLLGYVTASSTGTVSGKVTVPAGTVPGDYSIVMIQPGQGLSGSATLHVTGAAVQVTPSEASPGKVVSVSGSGFGPNEVVDIRWNGPAGTLLGYRTTTSTGAMSGKVTIPVNAAPGTYTLHLQGQTSGIVGSVTVVVPDSASTNEPGIVWRPGNSDEGLTGIYVARPTA